MMTKLQRPITAYLRENVHYTVSGFNFPATFLNLLLKSACRASCFTESLSVETQARAFSGAASVLPPTANASPRNAESCSGCRKGTNQRCCHTLIWHIIHIYMARERTEWDNAKDRANRAKHGVCSGRRSSVL
jgi:hypothetical protein